MHPRTPEHLYAMEKDGKYVLVDRETGAWIRTNHVGLDVIRLCNGAREAEEIATAVAALYSVPVDLIRSEVGGFIRDAVSEKILFDGEINTADSTVDGINTLWFHVTNRCNLNCVYCYADSGAESSNELSIHEINQTLAQMAEYKPYLVCITGGEPLTRSDLSQIESHGLKLRLITNGTLIDEGVSRMIAERFSEVQISLDGPDATTHGLMRPGGTFDVTMRAIRLLSRENLEKRIISCTATRLNCERIPEMVPFAYNLGWSFFLSRLVPTGRASEQHYLQPSEYDALVRECRQAYLRVTETKGFPVFPFFFQAACMPYSRVLLKTKYSNCGIGRNVLSISPTGDIYPCPLMHMPEYKVGNLREGSVAELMDRSLREFDFISVEDLEGCQGCHIKRICGGGCRALSLHLGQGLMGEDPYCDVTRKAIEDAFWNI
ncbi:MAG: PqqD family peptide modification chaperone [Deltaproteobacteria bacterium]|nr:PqqD family peptide modification chaperone [Deltaproteobacteria bacterium]MBW2137417.1 PqqD family peptide modification chaperone [Deltaproteobacteria bacterium]